MATFLLTPITLLSSSSSNSLLFPNFPNPISKSLIHSKPTKTHITILTTTTPIKNNKRTKIMTSKIQASSSTTNSLVDPGFLQQAIHLVQSHPPTWQSALLSNALIFLVGSPILVSGLSLSGIVAAFLLGTLTWRAFASPGFLLVATYFVIGTAVTKVKMAQKEAQGVAEKRKGRRGPGSVFGSSAAGCVCALMSIYGIGGSEATRLLQLGFVASFCTKLSDTVSSEIGKAYGKTTCLITTFKIVPRGTEGAVSVEGTFAGLLASIVLASVACLMGQINVVEVVICVIASQIANVGESIIGAALQDKEGFTWLNNDAVNVVNISMGSILAVLMQQLLLQNWRT